MSLAPGLNAGEDARAPSRADAVRFGNFAQLCRWDLLKNASENVIDLDHLSFLHGFDGVGHSGHVEVDGPCFKTDFRFNGNYNYPILRRQRVELSAVVQIWGWGSCSSKRYRKPWAQER